MIRRLIREQFGVKLSEVSVGRLLKRLGFTPQRPMYRAWQQNEALVEQWQAKDFPKLAKRARRDKALIFCADESGIRSDHHAGRTPGSDGSLARLWILLEFWGKGYTSYIQSKRGSRR